MLGKVTQADSLITLTQGDADDWRHYTSNVIVIPNPVTYIPETISSHDGCEHRIICVGRLHEQKGFDMLIEAFALISDQSHSFYESLVYLLRSSPFAIEHF